VNGPSAPSQENPKDRGELLRKIESRHHVAKLDGAQFIAGARLRLRRGVDQDAALRIVAELQAVGANVEVEANRPPDEAILALDQFQDAEPEPDRQAALNEQMLAQLQSLDGDEPRPEIDREAATKTELAPAAVTAPDDGRFRPSGDWHQPMDLELERAPPPTTTPALPSASLRPDDEAGDTTDEEPAPSPIIDETWHPVPGRIAAGALRKNPPVRIAIGVVAGLALGWMFSQPYARHSERHVAELRAAADAERYRPVDEAQARVRRLDRDADDASTSGALGMAAIWVLVGGAAFLGWWRAT
jgi:hypothetical protein